MSYEQIDARTIIVHATPQLPTFPDRPERKRVEPKNLTRGQVLSKFSWTDADFEAAKAFGFPPALRRPRVAAWDVDFIWSEDVLDAWAANERLKANQALALLKAVK